jgi:hypothetical protein
VTTPDEPVVQTSGGHRRTRAPRRRPVPSRRTAPVEVAHQECDPSEPGGDPKSAGVRPPEVGSYLLNTGDSFGLPLHCLRPYLRRDP